MAHAATIPANGPASAIFSLCLSGVEIGIFQ